MENLPKDNNITNPVVETGSVNKETKNKLPVRLIAISTLILLFGITVSTWLYMNFSKGDYKNGQAAPLTKVTVRLNWLHQSQFTGMYVAKEMGYYKEAGLDVTLKEYDEGLDQSQELAEGKVDFAISTPTELLNAINEGGKIKAIAAIYQISPAVFVSLKSKNIKTPSDFAGKRLGAMGGNKEAITKYNVLLKQYTVTDAKIIELGFEKNEIEHLVDNDTDLVDMYRTDQRYLLDAKGIEYNMILPEYFGVNSYGDMIITSDSLLETKPELARAFVKATTRGWEFAIENQAKSLTYVAKYANAEYNDPKRLAYILQQTIPLIKPTAGQPIGVMNFTVWNSTVLAVRSAKLIDGKIEAHNVYTTKYLR